MRSTPLRSIDRPPWRWRFGPACFDEASLVLTLDGQPVELERRPLELLSILLGHAGEVVTKAEIVAALWTGRDVSDASLTKCVARLRRAIGDVDHTIVHTVHGYGYRFVAPVTVEDVTASPAPPAASIGFQQGDTVPGRAGWILVRRLGTGGYGDAWLTRHATTQDQRVVKLARDAAGTAALRREITLCRLLREALGRRDDLVHILDWNLEQPPCFVETAWSELGNLADWAAVRGGAAALDMALRIDLVAQIADALAAAHSMGVLHKDLKPANILMRTGPGGQPGIILADFGSGRAMDPAHLDAFGITRLDPDHTAASGGTGTQMYLAPELASGGAPTVQADIYALGVMLFQLVAGDLRHALTAGWEEHVADPLLRQDIASAAAGDPARRLTTAADLATRLRTLPARREAADRNAIQVQEAARIRHALERARARRGPMRALAAVLLLGFSVSTYLAIRAERFGQQAEREAARARAVTSFLTDDLLSAANPVLGANPNAPVKSVLAVAAGELDRKFAPNTADRAAVEAAIGGAYAGLADPGHALPLLRAALATMRQQLGDGAPQTQAIRLAMIDLAERMADLAGMRDAGRAVLAAHPGDTDTELRGRFALLYADCLNDDTDAVCIAKVRPFLAEVQRRTGVSSLLTLRVQDLLAYQLSQSQHFDEAIRLARRTVAASQAIFTPDNLHVQERRFHLAMVLNEAGQQAEAIAMLEDVRRRLLALSGTETELSNRITTQLGRAYAAAKRYDQAVPLLRASLAFNQRTHGEGFEFTRFGMNILALALSDSGQCREAIPLAEHAVALQRAAQGPDNEDTLWMEGNLAEEYRAAGDLQRALALYTGIVARARRVFTHGEWDPGHFEMLLGTVQAALGQDARPTLAESVRVLTASLGRADDRTRQAQQLLDAQTSPAAPAVEQVARREAGGK